MTFRRTYGLGPLRITRDAAVGGISAVALALLAAPGAFCQTPVESETRADSTRQQARELGEVVVSGVSGSGGYKIGRMSITGTEINSRPALLGEHDALKALQTEPGVVPGAEGLAGLYVRGGETDQNLYLLDGLPLLNVYHFGGLFSTFSAGSIERVDFYKGVFPPSYSGRASSIVSAALKKPDSEKPSGSFTVGLVSGQLYATAPLKKGGPALSVSLRRTWLDALTGPALAIINAAGREAGEKTVFHYNFTDMTVKLSAGDVRDKALTILFFYGRDDFKLGDERFDPDDRGHIHHRSLNKMSWGNWGATVSLSLATAAGDLKIQPYVTKAFSANIQENMNDGGSSGGFAATSETRPSVLQAGVSETFRFPIIGGLCMEAGLQQAWHDYDVGNPSVCYSGIATGPGPYPYPAHSEDGLLSGFAELRYDKPGPVRCTAGLRADRYLGGERRRWDLEPRVSIIVSLPGGSGVSLGYTRAAQYSQQVTSNYMYLPTDAWLPTASCGPPLLCDIYSLGYFKKFKDGTDIVAELWHKEMRNLAEYKGDTPATSSLPWSGRITFGEGFASGLDLEARGRYKSIGWNISYGLMWNRRKFQEINGGRLYPAKYDNRHKLDAGVTWRIGDNVELSGQWEYMTGNRITVPLYNTAPPDIAFPDSPFVNPLDPDGDREDGIDYFGSRNNVRMPSFHRLNLNLSVSGRISDRVAYRWEFGLYNAYCRMNPFSVVKSYVDSDWGSEDGDYRKFKTLSLLPIIPSVSYTLYF